MRVLVAIKLNVVRIRVSTDERTLVYLVRAGGGARAEGVGEDSAGAVALEALRGLVLLDHLQGQVDT